MKADYQLQTLATFVHGVLAGLHALGIVYNVKRRNWFDVTIHTAAAIYDIHSVGKHMREAERLKSI